MKDRENVGISGPQPAQCFHLLLIHADSRNNCVPPAQADQVIVLHVFNQIVFTWKYARKEFSVEELIIQWVRVTTQMLESEKIHANSPGWKSSVYFHVWISSLTDDVLASKHQILSYYSKFHLIKEWLQMELLVNSQV